MHGHDTPVVIPDPKGYESEDIILNPIIKWITNLLLFVGISSLVTWFIYLYMLPKQNFVGATNRFSFERRLPPEPRVQVAPKTEMKDFRLDEAQKTENAGWVDRQKGIVRIPIEQAMQDVLQRGFESTPPKQGENAKPVASTTKTNVPLETKPTALKTESLIPTEPNPTPNEAGSAKQ